MHPEMLLSVNHAPDIETSKFNCTELDGFDACTLDQCLACECEKEGFKEAADSPSFGSKLRSREAGQLSDQPRETVVCHRELGSSSPHDSLHSTPLRKRSIDYKYENVISREAVIAVATLPASCLVRGGMPPALIDLDDERLDQRRRLHKRHLQPQQLPLQRHSQYHQQHHHSPGNDLRPSSGFEGERVSNLPSLNFGILRSNSINSSSSSETRVRSLPASPAQRRRAIGRAILNSPLMLRKVLKQK